MKIFVSFNSVKRTLVMLLLVVSVKNGFAQHVQSMQPLYRNFTSINSGLPSNIIYKMVTDKYGYIWLATERGLVRYDGNSFKKYTAPQTDNEFIQAYKPCDSLLWLFGYSGNSRLFSLNTHTFSTVLEEPDTAFFKSPVILAWQKKDTLSLYRVNSAFSQALLPNPKRQWVAGKTSFINSLLTSWKIPNHTNGISADTLLALFKHRPYAIQIIEDVLILGNKIFRKTGDAPATLIFDGDQEKITGNISSFVRMDNNLYLGFVETQELLVIQNFFSGDSSKVHSYSRILTQVPVTSLICDYQGNLWVGTLGKGIYLFTPADLATRQLKQVSGFISGISKVNNGATVLGIYRDRVSILYNENAIGITLSNQLSINDIRAIYKTADNWFFFGNQNSYSGKGLLVPRNILPLAISSHTPFKDGVAFGNRYYFTTKSACFVINSNGDINTDNRYKGTNTLSVAPFNENICFYGTNNGIYRNGVKQRPFSSARINRLRVIRNNLVVCTQEGAFVIQLNENGELGNGTKILTQNCYDIKADDRYCYLKNGPGLVIFRIADWKLIHEIDAAKYSLSINDFLIEKDTLVLATNTGVYYMPKRFFYDVKNAVAPNIFLSCSITGFNPSKNISKASYSKTQSITIFADVLDYRNEAMHINYQISPEGASVGSWQIINDRAITLNNPAPGKYIVTVKLKGDYSGIENSTSHTIIIYPLWYQVVWVNILFWAAIALATAFFIRREYKVQLLKARKKMNDQLRMNELENKNLFAQLKPHFIFNVLTPLQSYFINGDDIGGLNYLDNYAKLMRGFLQESRESYITIEKEIEFLKHYLFVQQQRFSNAFTWSFEIGSSLVTSQTYIPTLILQPVVENAVEHGVKNELNKTIRICINIAPGGKKLLACVIDNGRGLKNGEQSIKPNHALQIIKERLELLRLKHQAGMLHIVSNSNEPGTTVTMELPLLTSQP